MKNIFPLLGIAEQLEKASKLEGAKEIYQKALDVSLSSKGQEIVDSIVIPTIVVSDIKKEAEDGIVRVEEKMRDKLKQIIKGKGLAIDMEVNKLLPFKEVQDFMPPIDIRDFKRLVEDIKVRGVQVPLVILNDTFEIICGFNRWRAAKEVGLDIVPAYIATMSREEAVRYATLDNLNRRHLTMEEKTGMVRLLLQRRGKRTVGRPKATEIKKIKGANEKGIPITIQGISDATGVSVRKIKYENKEMVHPCTINPKPHSFFIEKIPHRFPEVKGDQLNELVEIMQTKLAILLDNLNLTDKDKVRAEVTFFVKRKED